MKKILFSLLTLAAALSVTSCLKDIEGGAAAGDGDYVDASFAVTLGPQTKAFADGTKVNTLWAGLYETNDATNPTTFKWVADNFTPSPQQPFAITADGATAQFPGKVQLGKTYRVVFFAVYESDATPADDPVIAYQWHNTDNDLTGPTISYVDYVADSNLANDDKRDAFYGYYDTGAVTGNINVTTPIQLRRPFSQINVLVPTGNVPAGTITSSMTVANAPTELNLATKATSNPQNWSFTANTIGETAFGGYANSHKYVAMNYVLVNQDATADTRYNVGFTVDAGDATSGPKSIANVPLKPNGRTNIVGNVFAEDFNITVPIIIDPVTQTDQVLTTVTVTVGQTAADAVLLNGPTNINVGVSHKITEEADLPSFSYDPAGVAVAQWVVDDATAGTGHIKVTPLVTNGSTKITAIFPAVTKTDYSAASAVFYVKMGNGENDKILQDVEITTAPTKLTFAVGDKFAFDGAVTATFTNPAGTEVIPVANLVFTDTEVTPNTYVPGETVLNTAGTYNIVVTYTYNGKSLSDMILPGDEPYEITVTDGPALIDRELVFKIDQTAVTEATVTFGGDDNIFPTLSGKKIDDVTYSLENVSPAGCVTINESTGAVTLVGAGSATVKATASATTEYQAGVASYALTVNAAPAPTNTTIANVLSQITSTDQNNPSEYTASLTGAVVSYVNGTYAYLEDNSGAIMYYKSGHGLTAGQVISGNISGNGYIRNGLAQITDIGSEYTATTGGAIPETTVTVADLLSNYDSYLSRRIKLVGVTITDGLGANDRNGKIEQNGSEIAMYAQYKTGIELVANQVGDLITFPGLYSTTSSTTKQVYIYEASQFTPSTTTPILTAPTTASASATDTQVSWAITSNTDWTITPGAGVTASTTSGNGNATVTLSFGANTGTTARTFTATATANNCADVTITITQAGVAPAGSTTATVSIESYASTHSWVNDTRYGSVALDANITASVSTDSGNSGKYYTSGYEWRFYQTESPNLVISAANGHQLVSVKVTYNSKNTGVLKVGDTTVASGSAYDVSGTTASFAIGNSGTATNGQVKVTAIEVVYQ